GRLVELAGLDMDHRQIEGRSSAMARAVHALAPDLPGLVVPPHHAVEVTKSAEGLRGGTGHPDRALQEDDRARNVPALRRDLREHLQEVGMIGSREESLPAYGLGLIELPGREQLARVLQSLGCRGAAHLRDGVVHDLCHYLTSTPAPGRATTRGGAAALN